MNRFCMSFFKFFITLIHSNHKIKRDFTNHLHKKNNLNLLKSIFVRKNKDKQNRIKIFKIINWHNILRQKIKQLFKTRFFEKFDVKNYFRNFSINDLSTIMQKKIDSNVFQLLNFFRAIMTFVREKSHRNDFTRRYIIIFAIICFTYKSYTCINWSIQFVLQFHTHDIKTRILILKYQIDINAKYHAILKIIKLMQREMTTQMIIRALIIIELIYVWNNVEFIIEIREQLLNNIKKFIFWIIAQQIMLILWSNDDIHQHMFHSNFKLIVQNLFKHFHFNSKNDI